MTRNYLAYIIRTALLPDKNFDPEFIKSITLQNLGANTKITLVVVVLESFSATELISQFHYQIVD